MIRRLGLLVLGAVLLLPAIGVGGGATTVQQGDPAPPTLPWWGPSDFGEGWNIRVPVVVENDLSGSIENVPVAAEVDLGEAVEDAGWPVTTVAGRSVLQSFELIPESVRVVEYTNFEMPRTRSTDAQIEPYSEGAQGHEAQAIPARVITGFLDRPQTGPFEPSANPLMTAQWIMPGTTESGEKRHFVLYFDIVQNGPQSPQDEGRVRETGIDGLYWINRGTRVFGVGERVTVTAVNSGTDVTIHTYAGRNPQPVDQRTLSGGSSWTRSVGGNPTPWMVTATGPVVASSHEPMQYRISEESGFFPSMDGTLLGTYWNFPVSAQRIHVFNPGSQKVQVTAPVCAHRPPSFLVSPGEAITCSLSGQSLNVASSAPILVKGSTGEQEMYPLVSRHGTPTGTQMFGTVDGTPRTSQNDPQVGALRLSSLVDRSSAARLVELESDEIVLPPPRPGQESPTVTVPPWPEVRDQQPTSGATGPVMLSTLDPDGPTSPAEGPRVVAWGGPKENLRSASSTASTIPSPIGGRDARTFSTPTTAHVFAYHPATQVTVTRADGTVERFTLDRGRKEVVDASLDAPARIETSKPVAVVPDNTVAYGSGVVESPEVTAGPAQYRGELVSLEPGGNESEPMVRQVSFGQTATFEVNVHNLARGTRGQPLPDTVNLSTPPAPTGWNVTVSPGKVDLPPDGTATATLEVTTPETRGTGDRVVLPVRASSAGNPNMTDEVTTVTLLREQRSVGLWFEEEDGPTQLTLRFNPGEQREVPTVVQNTGSAPDTFSLLVSNLEAGWDARFVDGDDEVRLVELSPGQSRTLTIDVRAPPPGGLLLPSGITLRATSTNDTTVSAKAILDGLIAADSNLELRTGDELLSARPGEEATYELRLRNEGTSTADVQLNVSGELPPGWAEPEFRFRGDSLAAVDNRLSSVSPTGDEGIPLELGVRVPPDAAGGTSVRVLATATPSGGGAPDRLPLNVFVEPFVDLSREPVPPLRLLPGDNRTTAVALANDGNVDASLAVRTLSVPEDWRLDHPTNLTVPKRGNETVGLGLSVPEGADPGRRTVRLGLVDDQGEATVVDVPTNVPETSVLRADLPETARVPAGVPTNLTFSLYNAGNAPATTRLDTRAPSAWSTGIVPENVEVPPLERVDLHLTLEPPEDVSGPERIALTEREVSTGTPVHALRVEPVVPDFRLEGGTVIPTGQPGDVAVRGTLVNDANVTLQNLTVALVSGEASVSETSLDSVPANGNRIVVVTASPEELGETLQLVADPGERFPERDRSDNVAPVDVGAGENGAPLGVGLTVLGTTVAAALARRR